MRVLRIPQQVTLPFGYVIKILMLPDKEFVSLALGWLGGTASTVIAYYFGSSAGQDHAARK